MAGLGQGVVHGLTVGLTGYREGVDDQMQRRLVIEAAKQRQSLAEMQALMSAAQAGFDIGPQPSVRAVNDQNPTTVEAGQEQSAPPEPSQDGTVVGAVRGREIRVPAGGLESKAVRDQARKDAQKIQQRYQELDQLNEQVTDPTLKKTPQQLRAIAGNDALYNMHVGRVTGIARDPVAEQTAAHRANRDYDVAHPLPERSHAGASEPLVRVADPNDPDGPGMFVPRSQAAGMHAPGKPKIENAMQEAAKARFTAAVSEMNNAHTSMKEFEDGLKAGTRKISAPKQVLQRLANSFTHDDPVSAITQSTALSVLDQTDPQLARYIRRGLSFAEGESMISGRPSDFRTRMAAFLSTAASGASPEMVADIESRRQAIMDPLNQIVSERRPAHRSPTTTQPDGSVRTPGDPGGNVNLGAPTKKGGSGRTYTYGGRTYHVP